MRYLSIAHSLPALLRNYAACAQSAAPLVRSSSSLAVVVVHVLNSARLLDTTASVSLAAARARLAAPRSQPPSRRHAPTSLAAPTACQRTRASHLPASQRQNHIMAAYYIRLLLYPSISTL